jgi:hypothetical protein
VLRADGWRQEKVKAGSLYGLFWFSLEEIPKSGWARDFWHLPDDPSQPAEHAVLPG